ncbi:MAG: YqaE/Pmp3 family membrane protein [Dehalococcoidia bacterium]
MKILIAIVVPWLSFFLVGKPFQGVLALILQLTVLGWVPAAIWAVFVVNNAQADRRNRELIEAMRERGS